MSYLEALACTITVAKTHHKYIGGKSQARQVDKVVLEGSIDGLTGKR